MKEGKYTDEKILLLKRSLQRAEADYDLLTDEIPVCGKMLRFRWVSLFDGRFRMLLPEHFEQMPEAVFYEKGEADPEGMEGRWFEYKNFTLDEETYNMQFVIRAGRYLLAGTFNCRMRVYDAWKPLVLKALAQIKQGEEA